MNGKYIIEVRVIDKMQLKDIGDDLLITIIPQYLSPLDIFNFSIINKEFYQRFHNSPFTSTFYKILYNKKFTNNDNHLIPQIDQQHGLTWKDLFKLRVNRHQKVYTWGSNDFGRLGYLSDSLPNDVKTNRRGIHTPSNIKVFNNHIITDLSSTGFSFIILTNQGQLYYTGHDWSNGMRGYTEPEAPGPKTHDYYPSPSELALDRLGNNAATTMNSRETITGPTSTRIDIGNRYDREVQEMPMARRRSIQPILTQPPENLPSIQLNKTIEETNFVTKFNLIDDVKIISVSSGRQHVLALDDHNNIYTWDTGVQNKMGVKLKFKNLEITSSILKIFAGWNLSGIYVYNVGLIIWNERDCVTKEKFENQDFTAFTNYQIIAKTKYDIDDFTIGDNFVLFTKKSTGLLYKSELIDGLLQSPQPIENFNQWLHDQCQKMGELIKFTRLNCCFKNWVVFTNNDQILLGNDSNDLKIIPQLQFQNIKSIEIGDYHFLALTKTGEVLSWGRESGQCGCLGLGDKSNVLENNDTVQDLGLYDGIHVTNPLKVINPEKNGKWVQITASGWHSGGIFIANPPEL